ncbi:heat-inducible transcriptional repressor HrcA [Timonella sp. A28]|uniref:heat-inducible transcriptional repressor HrcA n=1 Tax=Timonella sp. A28 TaxID=3442640 RepID=UPI003EBBBB9A
MHADQRRLEVLRAIVEDYVSTREPVGSKMIATRRGLGVSSATIRNDMAALEEAGLIAQPHTSAGRVPTDLGYRVFVDRLSEVKPLSSAERTAIRLFLDRAVDLDDVVHRAGRLLAQITGQVAVVQYPSMSRSTVRHLELVQLHATRLLVVVITDTGRVEQRNVEVVGNEIGIEAINVMRQELNEAVVGLREPEVSTELAALISRYPESTRALMSRIADTVIAVLAHENDDRIVLAGTANLTRTGSGVTNIRPVLEALEEQVVLLKLLSEMADDSAGVSVRIGHETQFAGLLETSVVSTPYGGTGEPLGAVGAIGPTGMDYSGTIASVRAVARYLTRILSS